MILMCPFQLRISYAFMKYVLSTYMICRNHKHNVIPLTRIIQVLLCNSKRNFAFSRRLGKNQILSLFYDQTAISQTTCKWWSKQRNHQGKDVRDHFSSSCFIKFLCCLFHHTFKNLQLYFSFFLDTLTDWIILPFRFLRQIFNM